MSIVLPDLADARVLDLFAGSGALGIEALSRGAREVVFVESAPRSLKTLRDNLATLGVGPEGHVRPVDALRVLRELGPLEFDVAFADPPYGRGLAERVARRWLDAPFARVLGIEHEKRVTCPAGADRRAYGDTVVSFYRTS